MEYLSLREYIDYFESIHGREPDRIELQILKSIWSRDPKTPGTVARQSFDGEVISIDKQEELC